MTNWVIAAVIGCPTVIVLIGAALWGARSDRRREISLLRTDPPRRRR